MRKGIWPILVSLIFLAGCQSSRFMQDDMYFTSYDAIREVRQFEVAQKEKQDLILKKDKSTQQEEVFIAEGNILENYYDYSYTARLRRFSTPNNSWAYYDPYYTNYYWFNNSKSQYFGNSVYSTYSFWGANIGNNYNSNYSSTSTTAFTGSRKNWINPWSNNNANSGWTNPYNKFTFSGWNRPNKSTISWNNDFCYNNMYYNSKDNNCYWWWWQDGNAPGLSKKGNFAALMQRNGVSSDVTQRPDINYTQIKTDYQNSIASAIDTVENTIQENDAIENSSLASKNSNGKNSNGNKSNSSNGVTNNTSNTSKRWDNYNADVNISPNTNDNTNNNWSRSGVFSEGSRNNNYEFKGTVIQKKKPNDSQDGSQSNDKAPNRK